MPSPTQIWGATREARAEELLVREGYVIVERNWRGGGGEIDRIAYDGDVLCFVEVRARSSASFGAPAETVDHRKQRKIVRAAAVYLSGRSPSAACEVRFDVVSIVEDEAGPADAALYRGAFDGGRMCLMV